MSPLPFTPRTLGRYVMAGPIAVGGMASVHFGRLEGPVGFRKTVAIKRMLASAADTEARAMLLDEAKLASRIRHANVVQTLDVIEEGPELFIVLEYVHGESFDQLLKRAAARQVPCPPPIAAGIVAGALRGLHAAHEVKGDDGHPLDLVHRDFSPHNVLVGVDGVPRVMDFGVARARGRMQATRDGQLKGKLAYLSPEQVHGEASRRSDLFAAGIVLWEALTGQRLFDAPSEAEVLSKVLLCRVPSLPAGLEAFQPIVDRALDRDPEARFTSALEMAGALEAVGVASTSELAAWVSSLAKDVIDDRGASLDALERLVVSPPQAPVTAPPPIPLSRARSTPVAAVVALVLLLVVAGALGVRALVDSPPTAAVLPPPPREPEPPTVNVPPPAEPKPPEPAVVVKPKPPPTVAPTKREEPPKPAAADRCNPPFTIDENGVKQFKVECLK